MPALLMKKVNAAQIVDDWRATVCSMSSGSGASQRMLERRRRAPRGVHVCSLRPGRARR